MTTFVKLGNLIVNADNIVTIYPHTGTYIKNHDDDIRNTTIKFRGGETAYTSLDFNEVIEIILSL